MGCWLAPFVIVYWATATFFPWTFRATIPPSLMRPEIGHAVLVDLKGMTPLFPPFVTLRSDYPSSTANSSLLLSEDGRPLGPAHSPHEDIRVLGNGRYSHWGRILYFSASDNSDPVTNGRRYLLDSPITPTAWLTLFAVLSGLLLLRPMLVLLARNREFWPARALWSDAPVDKSHILLFTLRHLVDKASRPIAAHNERWLTAILIFALVAAAWAGLYEKWEAGHTMGGALASFLPFTDASGYFTCANNLLDFGHFSARHAEWCSRRPIYVSLLAPLMALAGRNLHVALLIQAAVVSLAIAMLAREVMRLAGVGGAALVVALVLVFASDNAFPLILSESAGLVFGMVGIALLLRGAETGRPWLTYAGIAALSIALNARAGAFFVLPFLVLWAGYDAYLGRRNPVLAVLAASAAAAFGFGLELALIALNGVELGAAHANFSYTLYGLAVGGKGWTQIYIDHPEILSAPNQDQIAYRLAFEQIVAHPLVIVRALSVNYLRAFNDGLGISGGSVVGLANEMWILWLIGFVALALRFRDSRHALVAAITAGGLLSGPFIVQDGAPRVYAATLGGDALQAALGLSLVLQFLVHFRLSSLRVPSPPVDGALSRSTLSFSALLLLATLISYTPLGRIAALSALPARSCPEGEETVVTRLGFESPMLTVVDDEEDVRLSPPRVRISDLRWWISDPSIIEALHHPTPFSFVLAYQRKEGSPDEGHSWALLFLGDLSRFFGDEVRICFKRENPRRDSLWRESYRVRSLGLLNASPTR
jgi:hypothetical protein